MNFSFKEVKKKKKKNHIIKRNFKKTTGYMHKDDVLRPRKPLPTITINQQETGSIGVVGSECVGTLKIPAMDSVRLEVRDTSRNSEKLKPKASRPPKLRMRKEWRGGASSVTRNSLSEVLRLRPAGERQLALESSRGLQLACCLLPSRTFRKGCKWGRSRGRSQLLAGVFKLDPSVTSPRASANWH